MAKERNKRLVAEMRKDRGYIYPEWEFLVRHDPDFMERYNGFYREALAKGTGLAVKYRELVALGILAFRGVSQDSLANHIRRAYQFGATRGEILGALEAAAVPGGAVTFLNGLRALIQVENTQKG